MEGEGSQAISVMSNMDLDNQLASLEESLKKVQNKFTQEWTGSYLDTVRQQKENSFKDSMVKHQNKLSSVMEEIEKLKDEDNKKRTAGDELNTELKHLKTDIENVKKETDSLLQQCEQMKKQIEKTSVENKQQKKYLEEEEKAAQHKIQELEKAVSYFTDGLGLQLKKVSGGRLQMVFTCIDYKDPTKPFYCFTKINEDRTYSTGDELNTELKHLKTDIENVKKETDSLLQQCEQMKKQIEKTSVENKQQKKYLEEEEKAAQHKIQELEKAVSYFTDGLGLQLKKVSGGRLQMVFTCIDYKDPTKPYYCFTKINEDRTYSITDCQPPVEDLDELCKKLNETNNFKAFIVTLMKKFKALV